MPRNCPSIPQLVDESVNLSTCIGVSNMESTNVERDFLVGMDDEMFAKGSYTPERKPWQHLGQIKADDEPRAVIRAAEEPPLPLHLEDDPTPCTIAIFDILVELFDSTGPECPVTQGSRDAASKAAKSINSIYPSSLPDKRSEQRTLDPEAFIAGVWLTMFETVKQIPPRHPAIQVLVESVSELEKLNAETLKIWGHDISGLDRTATPRSRVPGRAGADTADRVRP